jgi:hypothetical protein
LWLSSPSSDIAASASRSFIRLLPRRCCFRPWSLIPFLQSWSFQRPSFPGFLYHIVLVVSLAIVSSAPCHFCTVGYPSVGCGQFLPWSTIFLGPNFPEDVSLAPCHCCMTGHLPAGGNQLSPGSTLSSGHFLWFAALPCR